MPATHPYIGSNLTEKLKALGAQIRTQRKALRISASAASEAAGMSRVTLHRVEKGEPSVTMGAYLNAMTVLGLDFEIAWPHDPALEARADEKNGWIPARIALKDYPQLKQLAWHVQGLDELSPEEALSIYESNWRHIDAQSISPHERQLIDALRLALGSNHGHL
jgi:transcriptional regulator with XRE-family HTH domain